ncbi:MAG TPA: SDR family NAD(P)-dependent oxidoreductase [Candidatus Nitrosotalea sp.]|nr:SDR family NAD(P)-dependent oxidoreductase [Candidatus Nitrosotalea sp.]
MIVTGASSGIGRALALAAARAGYGVAINARRVGRLEEVATAVRNAGGRCVVIAGDVTARQIPARIVETARQEFGRIDVLVNNAGVGAYGPLLEQSDTALEAQWQLHVGAPLRLARLALSDLEKTHGQIFFVGSGVARVPLPNFGAYPLAKAAIRAAAVQLRRELRPRHIAVTYLDPGVVASEFHSASGIVRSMDFTASPERIARAILRGITRRAAVVNGVPWQTALTALGEFSGTLADPFVMRGFKTQPAEQCHPDPFDYAQDRLREPQASAVEGPAEPSDFAKALAAVARRMERVKLPPEFLRAALVPGATLELGTLAMRWAGMPNKNERAALREALDALAVAGYLEPMKEETWRVVRAAD